MNIKKLLAVGIILLFAGMTLAPSITASEPTSNQTVYSDENGTLSGYVKDASMNSIEGAKVQVYFHETYEENYTDSSGYYHVTNIPICYCLKNATVSKKGYRSECVLLSINETTTHNFVLTLLGNTLYVGGSGPGNYSRIQDAVDNASKGDTIIVYSGRYIENIVIEKSLSLVGISEEFGSGNDSGKPVIDGNFTEIVMSVFSDDVLIEGFDIVNSNTSQELYDKNIGIYVDNAYNVQIRDCGIYNNFYGIIFVGVKNSVITKSIISDNLGHGLLVTEESDDNKISDSNFTNNGYEAGYGICLAISTGNKFEKCNVIKNAYGFGIVKFNKLFNKGVFQKNVIQQCNFIKNAYNTVFDNCFGNNWNNNFYDDWVGLKGNTLASRLPYHISRLNFDMNPASEPFNLYIEGNFSAIIKSLNSIIHPINDLPLDLSDEELEVLSYLNDSKIVGLGEATHGTKEFFQLKHRIFKYLVENYNYKVFAFECDMGESYYLNNFVTEGKGDIEQIMNEKMHFWTWHTEEVKELLVWMKEYNEQRSDIDKIYFIGVDCQYLTYQADIILHYFDETNISLSEDCVQFLNEIDQIGSNIMQYYESISLNKKREIDQNVDMLLETFEDAINELINASSAFEYQFMKQLALNIKQVNDVRYGSAQNDQINYRDLYMAENTVWTSDLFGEKTKVALWAHNGHVANLEISGSVGFHLKQDFNDEYQIIGFAFSKGSFTAVDMILFRLTTHHIKQDPKYGSINYVFHHAKHNNFILRELDIPTNSDFDKYISQPQSFIMIGAGFNMLLHRLGGFYAQIDLKEMYDVIINWDTTEAAVQLS